MVYTTPVTRARVIFMMDNGASQREVRRKLGIDHATAGNIYKHAKAGYSCYYYAPKSERPSAISEAERRIAARKVRSGVIPNAVELQKEMFPDVCVEAVRRALKDKGLGAYRCRRKYALLAAHAAARRKWARERRDWTVEDWKRVVYSDESKFNLHGSDGNR